MTVAMKSWWALCRREWLEHQRIIGWAPLFVLGLILFWLYLTADVTAQELAHSESFNIQDRIITMSWPLVCLYLLLTFTTLLGTLHEERKDQSVLFWKSMPVSDTATVLSKLFTIVGVGSIVSVGVVLCAQLATLIVASAVAPESQVVNTQSVWSNAHFLSSVAYWLVGYVSQIFWNLPVWGWLLFVSARARSRPGVWAIAIPAVLVFLEASVFDGSHLVTSIFDHFFPRALPGNEYANATPYLSYLAQLWTSASMWVGIATGSLFIAGAILFRNHNNEL